MPAYKEFSATELSLAPQIIKEIESGNSVSAVFLMHSSIENMLQQIIASTAKQIDKTVYEHIMSLDLKKAALFLYLNETISIETAKEIMALDKLRHEYAHDFLVKYADQDKNEAKKFIPTHKKVLELFKEVIDNKISYCYKCRHVQEEKDKLPYCNKEKLTISTEYFIKRQSCKSFEAK